MSRPSPRVKLIGIGAREEAPPTDFDIEVLGSLQAEEDDDWGGTTHLTMGDVPTIDVGTLPEAPGHTIVIHSTRRELSELPAVSRLVEDERLLRASIVVRVEPETT